MSTRERLLGRALAVAGVGLSLSACADRRASASVTYPGSLGSFAHYTESANGWSYSGLGIADPNWEAKLHLNTNLNPPQGMSELALSFTIADRQNGTYQGTRLINIDIPSPDDLQALKDLNK